MKPSLHLFAILALLTFPTTLRAEVIVRLTPDAVSLFVHEPFTLRLEVQSDAPAETPRIPRVQGLAVTNVRSLPAPPQRRLYVFQIELLAEREATLVLPPFEIRAGEEAGTTAPLPLRIRAPRPAKEMSLAIAIEPTELRVGQPAMVTVAWTSGVPLARCKQLLLEIPLLADARCQLFPLDPPVPEAERVGLPVNGIRVFAERRVLPEKRVSLTFRYALVPREPCVLRAPPAELAGALVERVPASGEPPGYIYNQFFEAVDEQAAYERLYLTAPTPALTVRALPEVGRTARYADVVGPCELQAAVAPPQLIVGQPALFSVQLSGLVFARHIVGLPSAAFDGIRPEFQLSPEPIRESATDHTRTFTSILRPLRPGIVRIPPVVIQTFNPQSGTFQTLRSAALRVTVEPAPADAAPAAFARNDARPPVPRMGIRHNVLVEPIMQLLCDVLEFLGRYAWAFLALPPLLWLALRPLIRRWERCRRDPVYARAMAAWSRFRRTVGRDEEAAWRNYLADRLSLHAAALTGDTVAEALRERRVEPVLIAETCRRFEARDAAEYSRRAPPPAPSTRLLVRQLHKATLPLLLACGLLLGARSPAAESAEELFARALHVRGEKPDEAQALFLDAALRFEADRRFVNAGNAWFFAGANGRALANFRAAERRAPCDAHVGESIAFLRANRADAVVAADAPGTAGGWWTRFCTWASVLRAGVFVLAYLAAWGVFLAAQLLGWRIRRSVWALWILAVLVPLVSLAQTSLQPAEGVVIEDSVARLGPSYAYDPAFQQPLHQATEFAWIESRDGWVRIRLSDHAEGWLRQTDCMRVE